MIEVFHNYQVCSPLWWCCQPMCSAVRLFSSESQSISGRKYSSRGPASIFLEPVITSKASCQCRDEPICSISLRKTKVNQIPNYINFTLQFYYGPTLTYFKDTKIIVPWVHIFKNIVYLVS